jgi:hypothetical protein
MLFLCLSVIAFASAALLPVKASNPCLAFVNGSFIDISTQFQWPIVLAHQPGNAPQGFYDYELSCSGQNTSCGAGVSVCQVDSYSKQPYVAGSIANAIWSSKHFNGIASDFEIQYTTSFLRMSFLHISIDNSAPPSAQCAAGGCEGPNTAEYHFDLTINCKGGMIRNCH